LSLGELVAATEPGERRRLADEVLVALSPPEDHEPAWEAMLSEPGLVRYAALALFARAAGEVAGDWRPPSDRARADFDGLGDLLVLGHEAEEPTDRLLGALVAGGASAARDELLGLVRAVVDRAHRQLASGVWEPDPADPIDGGQPIAAEDRQLLRDGAARLEAWEADSLR
jgi:hypothetical protein